MLTIAAEIRDGVFATSLLLLVAPLVLAQATGRITGTVISPAGEPLPGVTVVLSGESESDARVAVTRANGNFTFDGLSPGNYLCSATLSGYVDYNSNVAITAAAVHTLNIELELSPYSETVLIRGTLAEPENEPEETISFDSEQANLLPLPTDQFQEMFPLVPGVVRDPEGRLSFNGARPSQSSLLVNGANVTDPITGEFALELPLKAIHAVEVHTLPYSAEFGQVTGAVAEVKTSGGTDDWDVDVGDVLPKLNFRDGKIKGIRSAVPQVKVSGPLKKGRAWIAQSVAYRFVRTRTYDLDGEDQTELESYDTLTQIDVKLNDAHMVTGTFSVFPTELDNYGLSPLVPAGATPDFHSTGWNFALSERALVSGSLVETFFAAKTFDVTVQPKSESASSSLTPNGLRENYFNDLERDSLRIEAGTAVTRALPQSWGQHVLKFGVNVARTSFSGIDASFPVDILGTEGELLRRIAYTGDPGVDGSDLRLGLYVQDRWRPGSKLGLDVGLRYDYDRLVNEHQFAPRLSVAFVPEDNGRTTIKGGFGIFYDRVLVHASAFERFQQRVETSFGPSGGQRDVVFANRIAPRGLDLPRGITWNVEATRRLGEGVNLRVAYRERYGSREMLVDRLESDDGSGTLLLSSAGSSKAVEFDVTLRINASDESELFVSYARSRSIGDLNSFGDLYRNLRSPLLLENENSRQAFDVPSRFLLWGVWKLPGDIVVSPGVEWRTGFPWTVFTEGYHVLGERNRPQRFPVFFSADLRVTKAITFKGKTADVGVQFFNLGSHYNPRDVFSNVASPLSGTFVNSVDMSVGLRFTYKF